MGIFHKSDTKRLIGFVGCFSCKFHNIGSTADKISPLAIDYIFLL